MIQKLKCSFLFISLSDIEFEDPHEHKKYFCYVEDKDLMHFPLNFCGTHENNHTNMDVEGVLFQNCGIDSVPQGLAFTFPNLKILAIIKSTLSTISRKDMIGYRNLERFYCIQNRVARLSSDLFEGFHSLQYISFRNNQLDRIAPNILDGLTNLKRVSFEGNTNYDVSYSDRFETPKHVTLTELKNKILVGFMASFKVIENITKPQDLGLLQTVLHHGAEAAINDIDTNPYHAIRLMKSNESVTDDQNLRFFEKLKEKYSFAEFVFKDEWIGNYDILLRTINALEAIREVQINPIHAIHLMKEAGPVSEDLKLAFQVQIKNKYPLLLDPMLRDYDMLMVIVRRIEDERALMFPRGHLD